MNLFEGKKFGYGCMRLPVTDPGDNASNVSYLLDAIIQAQPEAGASLSSVVSQLDSQEKKQLVFGYAFVNARNTKAKYPKILRGA